MKKERYVAVFTTASCTGFAYSFSAMKKQRENLEPLIGQYNSLLQWTQRNCDGSVSVDRLDRAIERHNRDYKDDVEFHVNNEAEFLEYFENDGEGRRTTLVEVKKLLSKEGLDD